MTENEINITDMIKALQCIASQDADGDCYCDHFNAHLTCEQFGDNARLDEKHMSCGGIIKDTQSCPYSQKTYGVCYEDGELWWLKDIADMLTEIQQYRAIGTVKGYERAIESSIENCNLYKEYKAKVQDFEAIGSVEELKALKEKSVAKKPVVRGVMGFESEETYYCPNCNKRLYTEHFDIGYCNCGQSIKY